MGPSKEILAGRGDIRFGRPWEVIVTAIGGGWWTPQQAADAIGCTVDHVRDLLRQGKLTGKRDRRRWWVEPASVARYLGRRAVLR